MSLEIVRREWDCWAIFQDEFGGEIAQGGVNVHGMNW